MYLKIRTELERDINKLCFFFRLDGFVILLNFACVMLLRIR